MAYPCILTSIIGRFRGGSDLVNEGRVAVAGDEAGPDPLDLVRTGLAAGENGRLDGFHRAKLLIDGNTREKRRSTFNVQQPAT